MSISRFASTVVISICWNLSSGVAAVSAGDYVVDQKNKEFSTDALNIEVGDTISFLNSDPFYHNIYSLSTPQPFDLGSYPQGQSRSVTFETAGTVEVRCAIHPHMKMTIEVKEPAAGGATATANE